MLDYIQSENFFEVLPDLEALTYCVRNSASTASGQDTFTAYTLFNCKRRPAKREELTAAGLTLSDESIVFMLQQFSLENSVGYMAQPYVTFQLIDQTAGVFVGNTTSSSNVITGLVSTAGLLRGMGVVGNGIAPGSLIQSIGDNQITLSQPCTATASGVQVTAGVAWEIANIERVNTKAYWKCTCKRAW